MLFMTTNTADDIGTWTSVNTSDPYFPPENLQNFLAAKVWRSGTASATERLLLDLGAGVPSAADRCFVLHAQNFADVLASDVTIEGNATNAWGSPTFSDTIPAAEWGGGTAFLPSVGASNANLRWWRITLVKTNAADQVQIGRVFFGPYTDTGVVGDPDMTSIKRTFAEITNKDSSIRGQVYSEQRANFIRLQGKVSMTTEVAAAAMRLIWPVVGTWKPFFILLLPTGWPTDTLGVPYYVRLSNPIEENLMGYGTGYLWNVALSFEEQL